MKPVKNKIKTVDLPEYRCLSCGGTECGVAVYTIVVHGIAKVINMNGELDDYETMDEEREVIDHYECVECGARGDDVDDIFSEYEDDDDYYDDEED